MVSYFHQPVNGYDYWGHILSQICSKCGYTTNEATSRCALCKTPFSEVQGTQEVRSLGGAPSSKEPLNKQVLPNDDRNWFVKSIHGRSIGGMVLSILMILGGLAGGGMTRANMFVSGAPLVSIGVVVLIISTSLFFATRRS